MRAWASPVTAQGRMVQPHTWPGRAATWAGSLQRRARDGAQGAGQHEPGDKVKTAHMLPRGQEPTCLQREGHPKNRCKREAAKQPKQRRQQVLQNAGCPWPPAVLCHGHSWGWPQRGMRTQQSQPPQPEPTQVTATTSGGGGCLTAVVFQSRQGVHTVV